MTCRTAASPADPQPPPLVLSLSAADACALHNLDALLPVALLLLWSSLSFLQGASLGSECKQTYLFDTSVPQGKNASWDLGKPRHLTVSRFSVPKGGFLAVEAHKNSGKSSSDHFPPRSSAHLFESKYFDICLQESKIEANVLSRRTCIFFHRFRRF
jgi:hypothetical protein